MLIEIMENYITKSTMNGFLFYILIFLLYCYKNIINININTYCFKALKKIIRVQNE